MVGDFLFIRSYSLQLILFKKIVMPNLFRHLTGQVTYLLSKPAKQMGC
jgi:hypothetical protein